MGDKKSLELRIALWTLKSYVSCSNDIDDVFSKKRLWKFVQVFLQSCEDTQRGSLEDRITLEPSSIELQMQKQSLALAYLLTSAGPTLKSAVKKSCFLLEVQIYYV